MIVRCQKIFKIVYSALCACYVGTSNIMILNKGSFSELEEADLSVLWIPRRARVRILTLAGAMRRRIAVFTQQIEAKSYKNLEKQLLGSSSIKALAIDGDDKIYTTKAELKRAWERAAKDESKHQHEDIIQRKEHMIDLQVKIDAIKRYTMIIVSHSYTRILLVLTTI